MPVNDTLAASMTLVPTKMNTAVNTFNTVQSPPVCCRIAPAVGDVTSPGSDPTRNMSPVRKPISGGGEICATNAAISETYAPEKKPKSTAKAMIPPSEAPPGIQSATQKIPVA